MEAPVRIIQARFLFSYVLFKESVRQHRSSSWPLNSHWWPCTEGYLICERNEAVGWAGMCLYRLLLHVHSKTKHKEPKPCCWQKSFPTISALVKSQRSYSCPPLSMPPGKKTPPRSSSYTGNASHWPTGCAKLGSHSPGFTWLGVPLTEAIGKAGVSDRVGAAGSRVRSHCRKWCSIPHFYSTRVI